MDSRPPETPQVAQDSAARLEIHHNARAVNIIPEYLSENAPEFRTLAALRQKGWDNPAGDEFFRKQRQVSDQSRDDPKICRIFYEMMKNISHDMHKATGVFDILTTSTDNPKILDFCVAPGGYLETSMWHDPRAQATAFSLGTDQGGHEILMPPNPRIAVKFMDITMLAADMGVDTIPAGHPDFANFLPRELAPNQFFDLVICDGQVLRTNVHARAEYRESREATRLTLTQLALGLDHLTPGGTMVVLLHHMETWGTLCLMRKMHQFASVQLFKHPKCHAKRSAFYMIATKVNARCPQATEAIEEWKGIWKVATFGSEEAYRDVMHASDAEVHSLLKNFGPRLVEIARPIWVIQAKALEKASFVKGASRGWGPS
ncbi:hypothetical protein LTR29_015975 [Friedmanniomyces endolithicus]|nr:hypothetical protein LTR29_015975 [Friedmanniomyces endolithicus]